MTNTTTSTPLTTINVRQSFRAISLAVGLPQNYLHQLIFVRCCYCNSDRFTPILSTQGKSAFLPTIISCHLSTDSLYTHIKYFLPSYHGCQLHSTYGCDHWRGGSHLLARISTDGAGDVWPSQSMLRIRFDYHLDGVTTSCNTCSRSIRTLNLFKEPILTLVEMLTSH